MTNPRDPWATHRGLEFLDPKFEELLCELTEELLKKKLKLVVGAGLRGPAAQARIWCASRTASEVESRRTQLVAAGATKLASLLLTEWSAFGPVATCHLPGNSWHQWGMAADVAVDVGGVLVWSGSTMRDVGVVAECIGLRHFAMRTSWEAGGSRCHVQFPTSETPLNTQRFCPTWKQLEEEMLVRYDPWWEI